MACKEFETYAPRSSGSPSLVLGNVLTFLSRYCRFRRTDYAHCWIQGIRPIKWVILAIPSSDISNNFVCATSILLGSTSHYLIQVKKKQPFQHT
jgi:hypothetical protein